jgi:ribosome-binding factor A
MGKKNLKKSIKVQRKEAILRELVGEAFASLDNEKINRLAVTDVVCSRDGSDAKVYLEKGGLGEEEQRESLRELKQARRYIQHLCRDLSGWYKVPNLTFTFDQLLEQENRMEQIFKQIEEERKRREGEAERGKETERGEGGH